MNKLKVLITCFLLTVIAVPSAWAWKPRSHIYLATELLRDASDGSVSIYRVDHKTGKIKEKIGDYGVDPRFLNLLRNYTGNFLTGTIGPDAYPDLIIGQQIIHVDNSRSGGSVTNDWLEYMWDLSFGSTGEAVDQTPEIQAFVLGFLMHAAGDVFIHTFINYFAGGEFEIGDNAVRHLVMEGYIDKRFPASGFSDVTIDGVEDFIYRRLVYAQPGSELERLFGGQGEVKNASIAYAFSNLRKSVDNDFDSTVLSILPGWGIYKEHWLEDIDDGLKAWPRASHEITTRLLLNPSQERIDEAKEIAKQYAIDHLLVMAGLPDAARWGAKLAQFLGGLVPQAIKDFIKFIEDGLVEYLVKKAFKMSLRQFVGYMKNPQAHFNPLFDREGSSSQGRGPKAVKLKTFNKKCLKLEDEGYDDPSERIDYRKFPPAYNTVTMTKLMVMERSELNRFLADVGAPGLTKPNIALGFIKTLDGDNQWKLNPKMVLAKNDSYEEVFMCQTGEERGKCCPCEKIVPYLKEVKFGAAGKTYYHAEWIEEEDAEKRTLRKHVDEEFKVNVKKVKKAHIRLTFAEPLEEVKFSADGRKFEVKPVDDENLVFEGEIDLKKISTDRDIVLRVSGEDEDKNPTDANPETLPCISDDGGIEKGDDKWHKIKAGKDDGSSVVILLDASGSMGEKGKMAMAKNAAKKAVLALRKEDEVALITFSGCGRGGARVTREFTKDKGGVISAIESVQPGGETPLAGAIKFANSYLNLNASYDEKGLIILSDGEETCGGSPVLETLKMRKQEGD